MPSAAASLLDSPILTLLSPRRVHRNSSVPQLVAVSLARGESMPAPRRNPKTLPRLGRTEQKIPTGFSVKKTCTLLNSENLQE